MENFVDRIIDTDRKAREIIENAQHEKETLLKSAEIRAAEQLAVREAESKEAMIAIDAEYAARETSAMDKADAEYISAKHKLDDAFESGRAAWLKEITDAVVHN